MTIVWWSIFSFSIGWLLGRTFLRIWFRKELDKLQKSVLENVEELGASNLKILEVTNQLQAMIQASAEKGSSKK